MFSVAPVGALRPSLVLHCGAVQHWLDLTGRAFFPLSCKRVGSRHSRLAEGVLHFCRTDVADESKQTRAVGFRIKIVSITFGYCLLTKLRNKSSLRRK